MFDKPGSPYAGIWTIQELCWLTAGLKLSESRGVTYTQWRHMDQSIFNYTFLGSTPIVSSVPEEIADGKS